MRIALRFLANVFLLVAIIALVYDSTPALQGTGDFALTPFTKHWQSLSPKSLEFFQNTITNTIGQIPWTYGFGALISLPTTIFFAGIALICGYFGRRKKSINIYVN